jgi:hypothetical protein
MTKSGPRFMGKYRGKVSNNDDELSLGRIRATVEAVCGGEELGWALPCFPYAGPQVGLYLIPPVGANVWIEFENGDPAFPIWTGCFLREGVIDLPLPLKIDPKKKVLRTEAWTVTLDDSKGSAKLTIESTSAVIPLTRLSISQTGIKLTNESAPNVLSPPSATIELSGPKVAINGNALEVT